jgi:hypothetical protein
MTLRRRVSLGGLWKGATADAHHGTINASIDLHVFVYTKITSGDFTMNALTPNSRFGLVLRYAVATILFGGTSMAFAASDAVTLSGNDEVPAVTTSASGTGTVKVAADKMVSGSVTIKGMTATAAHIHEGAMGKNGPVVIALTKSGDDKWVVPDGAKFSDAQYESYKAGKLYVNVHSAAHKDGEIRGQLKP